MAHDSYRSPPPPEQPGFYDYSDPQYSQTPAHHHHLPHIPQTTAEYERIRPRAMSNARTDGYAPEPPRYQPSQQPINDAVASAFNKADTTGHLPPEVLNQITSQITANVMQQLRAATLDPQVPNSSFQAATSPSTHSGSSPPPGNRHVYTPPSPHRPPDDPVVGSPTGQTNFPSQSFSRATPPLQERRAASPLSQVSQASDSTHREKEREKEKERERERQRDREREKDMESRPKGPSRLGTGNEETTLEKIWGQLFDEESHPTVRLGQFLRGIAVHLIEDYEPTHSLVITPTKMQKYYEDTKLPSEIYPWSMIFDDRTSSISRLYRELEAQHHLVQERFDERPDIPGLTPAGFERWVTLLLQAHPDLEFQRLQKAVLDMPISNPDDKKERFPKEISRRLFPKGQDHQVRERLERAMTTHCNIDLPMRTHSNSDATAVPSSHHREPSVTGSTATSVPSAPPVSSSIERERQPYSGAPSDVSNDDTPTPQPIERERKPYVSQPGAGKNYDDLNKPALTADYKLPQTKPRSESVASQPRSDTQTSKTRPIPINSGYQRPAAPMDALPIPETLPTHHRSNSVLNPQPRPRNRSPSVNKAGGDYRRSDGDVSAYAPLNYGSYPSSATGDVIEDNRRYGAYRDPSLRDDPQRQYDPQRGRHQPAGHEPVVNPRSHYASDEEYYHAGGRSFPAGGGSGYDYSQPYPPAYR